METTVFNKERRFTFITFLLLFSFAANAQFQIVGMQFNGQNIGSVNLTILSLQGQPYTGPVAYDPNKMYSSGTTFKTPAATSIAILCKGQTQVMKPNSTLKLSLVNNGIKAETLTGSVQHILKDVKSKLSFYKAGNGYTWAHAEGTVFEVEAFNKSKKAKFSTEEGTIAIIEDVPVSINEAAKSQTERSDKAENRKLTTPVKTYKTAGQEYITENLQPIVYATYEEALAALDDETYAMEAGGNFYIEELADQFTLLGELYLDNGQPDMAIDPLRKAVDYNNQIDPSDIITLESYLSLGEALIDSEETENTNEGTSLVSELIVSISGVWDEYLEEFNYAVQVEEGDLAWELCYDLVEICQYLGWSYELVDRMEEANYYYNMSEVYESQL